MKYDQNIKYLCRKYKVKLIDCSKINNWVNMMPKNYYEMKSFCSGSVSYDPEITLGLYENVDMRYLAFLHELGHLLIPVKDGYKLVSCKMDEEIKAWTIALDLLKNKRLSNMAYKYMVTCLSTYVKPEYFPHIPKKYSKLNLWFRILYKRYLTWRKLL